MHSSSCWGGKRCPGVAAGQGQEEGVERLGSWRAPGCWWQLSSRRGAWCSGKRGTGCRSRVLRVSPPSVRDHRVGVRWAGPGHRSLSGRAGWGRGRVTGACRRIMVCAQQEAWGAGEEVRAWWGKGLAVLGSGEPDGGGKEGEAALEVAEVLAAAGDTWSRGRGRLKWLGQCVQRQGLGGRSSRPFRNLGDTTSVSHPRLQFPFILFRGAASKLGLLEV